jgi:hypothetical protein
VGLHKTHKSAQVATVNIAEHLLFLKNEIRANGGGLSTWATYASCADFVTSLAASLYLVSSMPFLMTSACGPLIDK